MAPRSMLSVGRPMPLRCTTLFGIAALLDRSVIETRRVKVVVETTGNYTVGCTVVDHGNLTKREPNCDVAFNADGKKFFEIIQSTFA